jgi:hypothetical protein
VGAGGTKWDRQAVLKVKNETLQPSAVLTANRVRLRLLMRLQLRGLAERSGRRVCVYNRSTRRRCRRWSGRRTLTDCSARRTTVMLSCGSRMQVSRRETEREWSWWAHAGGGNTLAFKPARSQSPPGSHADGAGHAAAGVWEPVLVVLRLNRAALCASWNQRCVLESSSM